MDSSDLSNSDPYYEIYTGVWTNWSKGSIFGRTLTLQRRDGDLLIAFVALFVTIVGTSFRRLACFALHSLFSSEASRDGIYHQRQAILRNSANGASGLWHLVRALNAWRKRGVKPYQRILPVITFATLCLVIFAAASGLSSRVSTGMGNEVLISSPLIGISTGSSLASPEFLQIFYPYTSRSYRAYSTYAQQCYTNETKRGDCSVFVKPRLEATVDRNASCPFDPEICRSSTQNILFDSGFLDTHEDFGANISPDLRFSYRRTLHCAPLKTEGYKKEFPASEERQYRPPYPPLNWTKPPHTKYYYGANSLEDDDPTYEYSTEIADALWKMKTASTSYSLGVRSIYGANGTIHPSSSFMPIEALQRVDADSVLVFLSANEIAYNTKVDDPWYSSHTPYFEVEAGGSGDPSQNQTNMSYFRDEPASVLGCAIQEQICNPRLPEDRRCTPLAGAYDRDANAAKLVESEEEKFALEWQLWALFYMSTELWVILRTLGSASLASGDSLYDGIQQGLPDNQWQLDVERWHSIMLATLQGQAVDVAEGPPDAKLRAELAKPSNKRERELCKRQRILSTAHSNFSVFFLAFIFTTGGLIILLSWFLETIVAFFQKRRNLDSYSRLEWCTNETLQLQRLAHEELGMGKWEGCDEDVPVTEKGERLAVLDVSDLKHPRLRVRPLGWEEMAAVVVKAERHGGEGNEGIDTGNNTDDGGGGEKGTRCSVEAVEQDGRVSPLSTFAPPRLDDEDTFRAATIAVAPDVNRSGLGNGGSGKHGA